MIERIAIWNRCRVWQIRLRCCMGRGVRGIWILWIFRKRRTQLSSSMRSLFAATLWTDISKRKRNRHRKSKKKLLLRGNKWTLNNLRGSARALASSNLSAEAEPTDIRKSMLEQKKEKPKKINKQVYTNQLKGKRKAKWPRKIRRRWLIGSITENSRGVSKANLRSMWEESPTHNLFWKSNGLLQMFWRGCT